MSRSAVLFAMTAALVGCTLAAFAEDVFVPPGNRSDPSDLPAPGARAPTQDDFANLARLASRLTSYNSHDDSATATYTCCRPDQKEEIARAERANLLFLERFPQSDFADDKLFHMASLAGLQNNYRDQLKYYEWLVADYPDSDYADDALWELQQLYGQERDAIGARRDALERIVNDYPYSLHTAHALGALAVLAVQERELEAAEAAVRRLAETFPNACLTPGAIYGLGLICQELGEHDRALDLYEWVINDYPYSNYFDDALYAQARVWLNQRAELPARRAYERLFSLCPATPLIRTAAQEYNSLRPRAAYIIEGDSPWDLARDLYEVAQSHQRFREFEAAVACYNELLANFPGLDLVDDAVFNIGMCYKQMNLLCNAISNAEGPDQLYRVREAWQAATGGAPVPVGQAVETATDATNAFMTVAFNMPGSSLGAEALHELAEVFEDMKIPELRAEVFQKLLINFPTCDQKDATEALAELLEWYCTEAQWPEATGLYLELADAYPDLFPRALARDTNLLVSVLKMYEREASHGWYERNRGHVRGRTYGPGDLVDDSLYVIGSLMIDGGDARAGVERLRTLLGTMPTSDYAPSALYNLARGYEKLGRLKDAAEVYNTIYTRYAASGLKDDAEDCYAVLEGKKDLQPGEEALLKAEEALGRSLKGYDLYIGEHVVVFSPFMAAAKLRQYNLPNVWDEAQRCLAEWTGLDERLATRQIVVLTPEAGAEAGDVIRLPAREVADPPNWSLGLRQLTQNFVDDPEWAVLHGMGTAVTEAFVNLGVANLQHALVSETRDTIGSASAVKLPFQNLIEQRARCVAALNAYVRDGARGRDEVSADVATGMLLALLDTYGYGSNGIVDWTPFETFFEVLREQSGRVDPGDPDQCTRVVVDALGESFNADVKPFFQHWGLLES